MAKRRRRFCRKAPGPGKPICSTATRCIAGRSSTRPPPRPRAPESKFLEARRRFRPSRQTISADIILQRRSAQHFDAKGVMPAARFFKMLDALLVRPQTPWSVWNFRPRLHPVLFVHRVDPVGRCVLRRDDRSRDQRYIEMGQERCGQRQFSMEAYLWSTKNLETLGLEDLSERLSWSTPRASLVDARAGWRSQAACC